jgi:hypothetical protein
MPNNAPPKKTDCIDQVHHALLLLLLSKLCLYGSHHQADEYLIIASLWKGYQRGYIKKEGVFALTYFFALLQLSNADINKQSACQYWAFLSLAALCNSLLLYTLGQNTLQSARRCDADLLLFWALLAYSECSTDNINTGSKLLVAFFFAKNHWHKVRGFNNPRIARTQLSKNAMPLPLFFNFSKLWASSLYILSLPHTANKAANHEGKIIAPLAIGVIAIIAHRLKVIHFDPLWQSKRKQNILSPWLVAHAGVVFSEQAFLHCQTKALHSLFNLVNNNNRINLPLANGITASLFVCNHYHKKIHRNFLALAFLAGGLYLTMQHMLGFAASSLSQAMLNSIHFICFSPYPANRQSTPEPTPPALATTPTTFYSPRAFDRVPLGEPVDTKCVFPNAGGEGKGPKKNC